MVLGLIIWEDFYLFKISLIVLASDALYLTGCYSLPIFQPSSLLVCFVYNEISWYLQDMGICDLGILRCVHSSWQFALFKFLSFHLIMFGNKSQMRAFPLMGSWLSSGPRLSLHAEGAMLICWR